MLLAYLDESYSPQWTQYWIAAVVVPEAEADPLTRALDKVVSEASRKHGLGLGARAELHGHPLFHGKKDWAGLARMVRARIGVYRGALEAIAAANVFVIVRGVDRPRLLERYRDPWHPHKIALQFVLEDVDSLAEREQQRALVIADEIGTAIEHRRELWLYQRSPTRGYRPRTLTRIVDTLHFAPSSASRLVQAADLVAYLYGRMTSGADTNERAMKANRDLWSILSGRVYNAHCWYP